MGFHHRVTAPRGHVRAPGATPSRPYFRSRRKLSLPDAANRFRPPPEVRPPPSMSLEAARGRRVPFLLSPGSVQNGSGPRAAAVLREVTARRAPPAAAVVRSRLCARPRGCGPPRHVPLPAGGPAEPRGAVGQRSAVVSTRRRAEGGGQRRRRRLRRRAPRRLGRARYGRAGSHPPGTVPPPSSRRRRGPTQRGARPQRTVPGGRLGALCWGGPGAGLGTGGPPVRRGCHGSARSGPRRGDGAACAGRTGAAEGVGRCREPIGASVLHPAACAVVVSEALRCREGFVLGSVGAVSSAGCRAAESAVLAAGGGRSRAISAGSNCS